MDPRRASLAGAGDVENSDAMLVHEPLEDAAGTDRGDFRGINELIWLMEPDALGEREFRTTNGAVEVEDGRAVTRLDVLDGALAIPSAGKLVQRILGRQRAI